MGNCRERIIDKNPTKKELTNLENRLHEWRYNDSELLEYLRIFYKENKKSPTATDFDRLPRYPRHMTYLRRFGSWNNALKMAGLQINNLRITDDDLLKCLTHFWEDNGRPPAWYDFKNNPKYPNPETYQYHFGSWQKALKLVGLDVDSMIRKGVIETEQQKARFWELRILDYLGREAIDLSGENFHSSYDGICPKGQTYDAKSSKLYEENYWSFSLNSSYRTDIEWFYLGAFDKDFSKLSHVWRIPGDFVDGNLKIGISSNYTYNIENMKEFEITDKFALLSSRSRR